MESSTSNQNSGQTPKNKRRRSFSVDELERGIKSGDRAILARALTLIESNNPEHELLAETLLTRLIPSTGGSSRIGITGAPGVGKSTFVEALGCALTGRGHRVAVLAIDPSSTFTGGSILGDKTRMNRLSVDPAAFVRPSPSAGTLGGVARKTRETLLVCEAAGYDVVLVETVGTGQSETEVAEMTDFLVALMIPGAGDELQGIKRGLLEIVDMIVINKSDGDNVLPARQAAATYNSALRFGQGGDDANEHSVLTCSSITGEGIETVRETIERRVESLRKQGRTDARRRAQMLRWMWATVDERLRDAARSHAPSEPARLDAERSVRDGTLLPPLAARRLVAAMLADDPSS